MKRLFLYVVWVHGDSTEYHQWFHVFPSKQRAIQEAREIAANWPEEYPNGIRFVKYGEPLELYDFTRVLVEQTTSVYHGA